MSELSLGGFVSCKILIVLSNSLERLEGIGFNAFKTIWQKGNGAGGIRTPDTVNGITVFKTVAFSRSATAP